MEWFGRFTRETTRNVTIKFFSDNGHIKKVTRVDFTVKRVNTGNLCGNNRECIIDSIIILIIIINTRIYKDRINYKNT